MQLTMSEGILCSGTYDRFNSKINILFSIHLSAWLEVIVLDAKPSLL